MIPLSVPPATVSSRTHQAVWDIEVKKSNCCPNAEEKVKIHNKVTGVFREKFCHMVHLAVPIYNLHYQQSPDPSTASTGYITSFLGLILQSQSKC